MSYIRKPAVSGVFYPHSYDELQYMVKDFLKGEKEPIIVPKAIIAPHAGYIYSGSIAASAYKPLIGAADQIQRVILLGPSHYVAFNGMAVPSVQYFETPLGRIPLDRSLIEKALEFACVKEDDNPHKQEHSLEVQLPFLQEILGNFELVPLVVGNANPDEVGEVIGALWGGKETIIVISSDLSHYHEYNAAVKLDSSTSNSIVNLRPGLTPDDACGCVAINGLLNVAKEKNLKCNIIDLRNSGDTAGDKDRVVGYGAYHLGSI